MRRLAPAALLVLAALAHGCSGSDSAPRAASSPLSDPSSSGASHTSARRSASLSPSASAGHRADDDEINSRLQGPGLTADVLTAGALALEYLHDGVGELMYDSRLCIQSVTASSVPSGTWSRVFYFPDRTDARLLARLVEGAPAGLTLVAVPASEARAVGASP